MTLQLHRPDGEGGLEPVPTPRTGATSSSRRAGERHSKASGCRASRTPR